MPVVLQVAIGGAAGAMLRYGLVVLGGRAFGDRFPWGTLAVNVTGCFLIGVCFVLGRAGAPIQHYASLLMPGLLGGFTTFSAFSLETFQLFERGRAVAAVAYIGASLALCLAAVTAGVWSARAANAP